MSIVTDKVITKWKEQAAEDAGLRLYITPTEWRELCDLALRGYQAYLADIRFGQPHYGHDRE